MSFVPQHSRYPCWQRMPTNTERTVDNLVRCVTQQPATENMHREKGPRTPPHSTICSGRRAALVGCPYPCNPSEYCASALRWSPTPEWIKMASVDSVCDDPAGLQGSPFPAFVVRRQAKHQDEREHPFEAHQLSLVMLWFSSPGEEGGHILRLL